MSEKGFLIAVPKRNFERVLPVFKKFHKDYNGFYDMAMLGTIKFSDEQIKRVKTNELIMEYRTEEDLKWLRSDDEFRYITFGQYDQCYGDAASIFALYDLECWASCKWTQDELDEIKTINNFVVERVEDYLFPDDWENWPEEYNFEPID